MALLSEDDHTRLTAADIVGLVGRREVSAVEVVDAALARLQALDDHLRAFPSTGRSRPARPPGSWTRRSPAATATPWPASPSGSRRGAVSRHRKRAGCGRPAACPSARPRSR